MPFSGRLLAFAWFSLPVLALSPALVSGCGSNDESTFPGAGSGGDASLTDGAGQLFAQDAFADSNAEPACTTGKSCGDGGVCAGSTCCAARLACGDVCCPDSQVCSFLACVTPGAVCHDVSDCGVNEYCEFSLGTTSDAGTSNNDACVSIADRTGRCLAKPPQCVGDAGAPDGGATCLEKCEYHPATTFTPVLKFAWGGQLTSPFETDVMMAPIVVQLDDDDCDGKITERDVPEIVFSTFQSGSYLTNGVLHAISIVSGVVVEKWRAPSSANTTVVNPTKQIAGGNFDGLPGNEIVACGTDGAVHAFKADGTALWTSPAMTCFMPSIADLEGDGTVEVIVEGGILNGADGTLKHAFSPALNGPFVVSDIDGNNQLDVVTSSRGYHADGVLFVDTQIAETASFSGTSDWKGPWAGIGDFDKDGVPEVVAIDNMTHQILLWHYDAAAPQKFRIVRNLTDMNAKFQTNPCPGGSWGNTHGGGPPTVADFNRDGFPDVGLAGGIGYVVFDGKKLADNAVTGVDTIMWSTVTTDCSSASTGSTVFDFDGDGRAEVVYSDEMRMRIYDGETGNELASVCNTTATLIEFPIVADVDNDGHADVVVVSNAYSTRTCDNGTTTKQAGVRIFGDANGSWVRTRRVWNEHAYHITNVAEDGTIPQHEAPNWTQAGLNNFRQNKQPGSEFAAPNLVAQMTFECPGPSHIRVTVQNVGEAPAPAGVIIGLHSGTPPNGPQIATATTTRMLYPAESEPIDFVVPAPAPATVYAVVDDTTTTHASWHECRTDDNKTAAVAPTCNVPR